MSDEDQELLDALDFTSPTVVPLRTVGAPRKPFMCEHVRELTEADIVALALPRGGKPTPLVRIHASHHSLAKCLASGMKPAQASLVTGYSSSRISILQADAAFQALVRDYADEAKSVFADLAERMNDMSLDALEVLQERLQASPETFSIPVLLDVVKAFADRTGHGPGQEVHLKVDRDFIDRPPRETIDEWKERRARELASPAGASPKEING